MTTYTVNHMSSIDCYKRAETNAYTVYSGTNQLDAYSFAVEQWLDMWVERAEDFYEPEDLPIDAAMLALLTQASENPPCISTLKEVHEYFLENARNIWTPEYINCPTEEVVISTKQFKAKRISKVQLSITSAIETIQQALKSQS